MKKYFNQITVNHSRIKRKYDEESLFLIKLFLLQALRVLNKTAKADTIKTVATGPNALAELQWDFVQMQ